MIALPVLASASVTDPVVNWAVRIVGDLGLPGIFLLMTPESAGIPIPSEATMLFAGFNVDQGRYSLAAAVAVGTIANLVGSWILYAAGYFGRQEVLAQHGSKFHITPEKLDQADRWFDKWGVWAVFFSRMLPIVRTFISLPAGVARMPFWKFSVATLAGCLPWVLMLTLVGREVGANWVDWKDRLHYVDYAIVAAIAIAGVYFVARRRRSGNEQENKTKPAPEIS